MNMPTATPPIAFIDLAAQRRRLGKLIDEALLRVVDHGSYILGPEVRQFERELAAFAGAKEVITCANGTDALSLVLMAKELEPGDVVFCPSFTFAATAEVIALAGATPYFVDVDERTFNIDADSLSVAMTEVQRGGLRPVGIIPVDLFGHPADYEALLPFARQHGLWVLCDAAQACGATYKGKPIGSFGMATTTSFFPAKPLGCYGDGGAIFTDDEELAAVIRSLRVHGQGTDKYDNVRIGLNGRLDTLQAAVLIEKLKIFPDEIRARQRVADRYKAALSDFVTTPSVAPGCTSVWAQYTIRVKPAQRDSIVAALKAQGVPTAIYYPKPLHRQTAYRSYPIAGGTLPACDKLAGEVLSLPMHPYMDAETQDFICNAVVAAIR